MHAQTAETHETLSDLSTGESAVISAASWSDPIGRRLAALGFVPGAAVTVLRVAPFGDPVEYGVRGGRVSLRRADARRVRIARS